jgi:hypothetical protein
MDGGIKGRFVLRSFVARRSISRSISSDRFFSPTISEPYNFRETGQFQLVRSSHILAQRDVQTRYESVAPEH